MWCTPKLFDGFNCESKGDDNKRRKTLGALLDSQHFENKGACWSSGMGIRKIDKQINYLHISTKINKNKLVNV
jgi:hypothetical protein